MVGIRILREIFNKLCLYIASFVPKYRSFRIYRIFSCRKIEAEIPLEFQKVTFENVEDVLSFRTNSICHIFKSFLSNDELGVYGYYEGKVIVHGWAVINKTSAHEIVNGYFDLPQDAVLIHFCSVDINYRGNKVYQELLSVLCGQLSDYDIYIDTDGKNYSAQKAIQRVGGIYKNKLSVVQCRNKFLLIKDHNGE